VIDTNLKGVWLAAQATAKRIVRHGTGGAIVNIASILGLRVTAGDLLRGFEHPCMFSSRRSGDDGCLSRAKQYAARASAQVASGP
jgi:NAD(P)-dependent dehydrogenase (short-subunit alcohol dehydrogenase family)